MTHHNPRSPSMLTAWPWTKFGTRKKSRALRRSSRPLHCEQLEDRTLPAATLLAFNDAPIPSVTFTDRVVAAGDVDLYRVTLQAGDRVTAAVLAQNAGSALDSVLRVLDGARNPLFVNDNFDGRDPRITFQA